MSRKNRTPVLVLAPDVRRKLADLFTVFMKVEKRTNKKGGKTSRTKKSEYPHNINQGLRLRKPCFYWQSLLSLTNISSYALAL